MDNYKAEVRSRWGNTDAYCEHEQRTKNKATEKSVAVFILCS